MQKKQTKKLISQKKRLKIVAFLAKLVIKLIDIQAIENYSIMNREFFEVAR